uniref:Uncharacterized protein n=1 Tax=Acrobeloides nanus TaxID=290746 RepID=A0A914CD13_9BILA
MGDHGLRFGQFRSTRVGQVEDNNPALFVVVPEKLRNNYPIMNMLQENSKQLISHFDLYASFVDIARNPMLTGPAKRKSTKKIQRVIACVNEN